jgi:hypothetical protein
MGMEGRKEGDVGYVVGEEGLISGRFRAVRRRLDGLWMLHTALSVAHDAAERKVRLLDREASRQFKGRWRFGAKQRTVESVVTCLNVVCPGILHL